MGTVSLGGRTRAGLVGTHRHLPPYKDQPKGLLAFQSVSAQTLATAESKKMAAMAFANYKRRVSW